ncbi:MAG: prolipoprotein diacylglyceryl transferase [Proteobacteria bacterium]|nr:prolipoprotein diacylglyceryl transferase [Pseudomonadota bacterium]MBU1418773.1 prolipoprotein diacylglyceryl transferase [Pseudomonadota bacterium]MBU1455463.1 prolipoprotein diacylglyceryl transferase [Pseudomonadota bacterium]
MAEQLFILFCSLGFIALFVWGFRYLPQERWQMMAVIPYRKKNSSHWHGANLTFYGFLIACAIAVGVLFSLILLQSVSISLPGVFVVMLLILAVCLPASRIMARLVEKKRYTFTIGGAFFCGLLLTPWGIVAVNAFLRSSGSQELDMMALLAALAIGYTLGEGLGRLACVSFGCCYGKPLKDCCRMTNLLFSRLAFVFTGITKKAVYEGALEGEKLIPIQGLTCILYTATALFSAHLFLTAHYVAAFLISLLVSQVWRIISETMRADFRGFSKVSAYQKMSFAALPYAFLITVLAPTPMLPAPSVIQGLSIFSQPLPMISVQFLWLALFWVFGRSMVTSSTISFQVVQEHI